MKRLSYQFRHVLRSVVCVRTSNGHPRHWPKMQSLSDLADSILVITFPQHSPHRNQSSPLWKAFAHVRTQRPCAHTPYQLLITCFPTCTMGGLTLRSSSRSGLTWPNQWPNFFTRLWEKPSFLLEFEPFWDCPSATITYNVLIFFFQLGTCSQVYYCGYYWLFCGY